MNEQKFLDFFNTLNQGEKIESLGRYLLEADRGKANGIRKLNYNEFFIEFNDHYYDNQIKLFEYMNIDFTILESIMNHYFNLFYNTLFIDKQYTFKEFIADDIYKNVEFSKYFEKFKVRCFTGFRNIGTIYDDFKYGCVITLPYSDVEYITFTINKINEKTIIKYIDHYKDKPDTKIVSLSTALKKIDNKAFKTFSLYYKNVLKDLEIDKKSFINMKKEEMEILLTLNDIVKI